MKRPKRVLAFVGAHPDDDVMGLAPIVALHREDPEFRFVLVLATDGEEGQIAPGSGATRKTLGEVRRQEDMRGWSVVGRQPDRHDWYGLPDGGLADLAPHVLEDRIGAMLDEERPDVVLSFGPDGITGHPDHIAVGAATDRAFLARAGSPGPGLRRLLHGGIPRDAYDRMNERLIARGVRPSDPNRVYEPRPVDTEQVSITVDYLTVWQRTRDAMRQHRSQWAPPWSTMTDDEWRSAAGAGHFVEAWPEHSAATPHRVNIFDGL